MATILAHIHVAEGREAEFEVLAKRLHTATLEELGCRHYEYWRGQEPGLYYCLLAFDDFHAFLTHQTSDHHEAASPELGELIRTMQLEWVDPVVGASALPPTRAQAAEPDASELRARYAKLFRARIAEWWAELR